MGLIRKMNSIATLGMVRFRNVEERTARYTRQTRNAVRAGNQMHQQSAQSPPDQAAASMWNWINAAGWVAPCGHPREHWSVSPAGVASCRTCWITVCPYCGKTARP
jgi:hypothetical protein